MKHIRIVFSLFSLLLLSAACQDDPLMTENTVKPGDEFNIPEFADGYSLCFDVRIDDMGGDMSRADGDYNDDRLMTYENYLNPEEFRILFFDDNDNFLFESRSRWFTRVQSQDGGNRWRVGIPVFAYLSDSYSDNDIENGDDYTDGLLNPYNWTRIAEILRTETFKIAVMANRPSKVVVPDLSDLPADASSVKGFGENGPFWSAFNSRATYDDNESHSISDADKVNIRKVFDLHHCQYDPIYENKSQRVSADDKTGTAYELIMQKTSTTDNDGNTINKPFMGAVSTWLHSYRRMEVVYGDNDSKPSTAYIRYYRLPEDQLLWQNYDKEKDFYDSNGKPKEGKAGNFLLANTKLRSIKEKNFEIEDSGQKETYDDKNAVAEPTNQYIPMYGIQRFAPLTTWKKGTTYNVSEQVGSQTGDYNYKTIFLLRSVVKLELRIPMFDNKGKYVAVDNRWAEIFCNNYMARCEPMNPSSPTDSIWSTSHTSGCEWDNIQKYGIIATRSTSKDRTTSESTFKEWVSWFYGCWQQRGWWNFKEHDASFSGNVPTYPAEYPQIFNPITQRLRCAFITDCYLPINSEESTGKIDAYGNEIPKQGVNQYHRWVIYCGEKNVTDPNGFFDLSSDSYANFFRIRVKVDDGTESVYHVPIANFNNSEVRNNAPTKTFLKKNGGLIENVYEYDSHISTYLKAVNSMSTECYPLPLLRNHFYRMTVSFGNNDDINVSIIDSEKRHVGGIVFN